MMKLDPEIKAKLEAHAGTMLRCMDDLKDLSPRILIVSGNRMGGG